MRITASNATSDNRIDFYYTLGAFIDDEIQATSRHKLADNDYDYWAPFIDTSSLTAMLEFIPQQTSVA